jgi:hypothetical protein
MNCPADVCAAAEQVCCLGAAGLHWPCVLSRHSRSSSASPSGRPCSIPATRPIPRIPPPPPSPQARHQTHSNQTCGSSQRQRLLVQRERMCRYLHVVASPRTHSTPPLFKMERRARSARVRGRTNTCPSAETCMACRRAMLPEKPTRGCPDRRCGAAAPRGRANRVPLPPQSSGWVRTQELSAAMQHYCAQTALGLILSSGAAA